MRLFGGDAQQLPCQSQLDLPDGGALFSLQLVRFIVGNLAVLLLSVLLINLCTVQLGLGKLTAKLVVTCFTLAVNFLISRLWIFKGQK